MKYFLLGYVLCILFIKAVPSCAQNSGLKTDREKVNADATMLSIPKGYIQNLHWDLPLEVLGQNGSAISWHSANPEYLSDQGKLLKLSPENGNKVRVKVKAMLVSGSAKRTKNFIVTIARKQKNYDGYLFAYFEGSGPGALQEQLRFGVSAVAIHWSALNENNPIIPSANISATGGIRDPHILRGEDGHTFYMVATDMNTFKDGWGYNPGIVMLRSDNLINWSHGIINLEQSYPDKFKKVQWVWAPQSIYDPAANKYMVYFTVKFKDNPALDFYCAYANRDFTGFEQAPILMFKAKYGAIDGDIIYKDGLYHFFYKGNTKDDKGNEFKNGIQQAIGKTLQGPWTEDFKYVDAYADRHVSVEGSGIFKLNHSDAYVLMYDLYRDLRYEYQKSTDLFNFSTVPESFTKNFNPRHGTVISITKEEAQRLNQKWKGVPAELLNK